MPGRTESLHSPIMHPLLNDFHNILYYITCYYGQQHEILQMNNEQFWLSFIFLISLRVLKGLSILELSITSYSGSKSEKKRLFGWNKGIVIFSKNIISFHHYGYLFLLVAIATYSSILVVQSLSSKKVHIDYRYSYLFKKNEKTRLFMTFFDFTRFSLEGFC